MTASSLPGGSGWNNQRQVDVDSGRVRESGGEIKGNGKCLHFECNWDLEQCVPRPAAPSSAAGVSHAAARVVLEDHYGPNATLPP